MTFHGPKAVVRAMRDSPELKSWDEAFRYVREADQGPMVVSLNGHPYKIYPRSGRTLCAATLPMHDFEGTRCDCLERESGGTIMEFTLDLGGKI
jgi:hypothetical protein